MNKISPQGDANGNAAAGSKALPGGEANCSPCCCSRRGACLSAFLMLLLTTLAALIALVAILGPPPRTPAVPRGVCYAPHFGDRNLRHREVRSPAHGHTAGKWLNWGLHAIFNAELRVLPVAPGPRCSSGGAPWGELGDALVNTTLDPSGAGPAHSGAQACVTQTNRTGFLCNDRSSCIPASRVCDGVRTCARSEDEEEALCRAVPQSLPGFLVTHCGDPASWIYSDQVCDGINNCGDCSDELSPGTTCPPCGPGWWRCPSTVFRYCSCIPRSLCRDRVQHCSDWSDEYSCPGPD